MECDLYITDPPYADAIKYHEITEFFIAWLRKNPPQRGLDLGQPSRTGDQGRATRTFAGRWWTRTGAMARHMPDNGMQIVMFTHQYAGIWADMATIVWGAGLHVTAAWYIVTETTVRAEEGRLRAGYRPAGPAQSG